MHVFANLVRQTQTKGAQQAFAVAQDIAELISDCLTLEPHRRPKAREVVRRILAAPMLHPQQPHPGRIGHNASYIQRLDKGGTEGS